MKKYEVRLSYEAIERVTYEVDAEDEAQLDDVIRTLLENETHPNAIERSRMIDVDGDSAVIAFVEETTNHEAPDTSKARHLKLI